MKLRAIAVICLALAFGVIQMASCHDAYQAGEVPTMILHGLAIVGASVAVVWGLLSVKNLT